MDETDNTGVIKARDDKIKYTVANLTSRSTKIRSGRQLFKNLTTYFNDFAVIRPQPALTLYSYAMFTNLGMNILDELTNKEKVIIDLSKVKDMDGQGLESLLGLSNQANDSGNDFAIYLPKKRGTAKTRVFLCNEVPDSWNQHFCVYGTAEELREFLSDEEFKEFYEGYLGLELKDGQ